MFTPFTPWTYRTMFHQQRFDRLLMTARRRHLRLSELWYCWMGNSSNNRSVKCYSYTVRDSPFGWFLWNLAGPGDPIQLETQANETWRVETRTDLQTQPLCVLMAIFQVNLGLPVLQKIRMMEVVVTSGAIGRTKLWSNCHHQHPTFLLAGCPSCHLTNSVKAMKSHQAWRYPAWLAAAPESVLHKQTENTSSELLLMSPTTHS